MRHRGRAMRKGRARLFGRPGPDDLDSWLGHVQIFKRSDVRRVAGSDRPLRPTEEWCIIQPSGSPLRLSDPPPVRRGLTPAQSTHRPPDRRRPRTAWQRRETEASSHSRKQPGGAKARIQACEDSRRGEAPASVIDRTRPGRRLTGGGQSIGAGSHSSTRRPSGSTNQPNLPSTVFSTRSSTCAPASRSRLRAPSRSETRKLTMKG